MADKIAATYERYGTAAMPSTRYRDLVDLVSIVTGASVPAAEQFAALASEFDRRQLKLPDREHLLTSLTTIAAQLNLTASQPLPPRNPDGGQRPTSLNPSRIMRF